MSSQEIAKIQSCYESRRLKYCVDRRVHKVVADSTELRTVGLSDVEQGTGKLKEDREGESVSGKGVKFYPGDVLFGKLRPYLTKAFIADFEGVASSEFLVLNPKDVSSKYLHSVLLSAEFIDKVDASTYGAKMPRASWDFIGNIKIPYPDIETQKRVTKYLENITPDIERTRSELERFRSIISERTDQRRETLVTGGVAGSPQKETELLGVESIPEHWDTARIGWLIQSLQNGWSPRAASRPAKKDEYGVLKLSAVSKGTFRPEENKAIGASTDVPKSSIVSPGQVLVTRANTPELVADACAVPQHSQQLIAPDLIFIIDVDTSQIIPQFLAEWLITQPARSQIRMDAHGSSGSMVKVSQQDLKNWVIPLPPKDEQKEIVDQINRMKSKSEKVCDNISEIEKILEEKRQALITSAITGQIDVSDE
ncbi:restriction endonuclease subunit S [Halobellus rufus]|uniref:restriction endonuclease subunit S n=1 Tax=Halobellus rufus TaxID=1448860 RepID=UPI0009DCB21E|nr:restriction endonuclease subunit S [Halobellus rufus]